MKATYILALSVSIATTASAGLITAIPGADDQGGMLMPMVSIVNTDNAMDPTYGDISISFSPGSVPVLRSLQEWSPGDWFAETAAWRPELSPPVGVGGTPLANAGNGDLFNSQYGFSFMAMPMNGLANIPSGKSLAIRMIAISSSDLSVRNYVNASNLWDPVFTDVDSQVLWNGNMWHAFFTLPANVVAGSYIAEFEVFIADTTFTTGTGWADYTPNALNASQDPNFTPAAVTFEFTVIPEPGTVALTFGLGVLALAAIRRRKSA